MPSFYNVNEKILEKSQHMMIKMILYTGKASIIMMLCPYELSIYLRVTEEM